MVRFWQQKKKKKKKKKKQPANAKKSYQFDGQYWLILTNFGANLTNLMVKFTVQDTVLKVSTSYTVYQKL